MRDISSLRVGIIGLGNIARIHCEALQSIGLEDVVTTGVDVSSEARASFADRYGVPVYDDHTDILDDVDAVLVTTPNRFHEEYTVDALEAGLDVLVEKPLAHDLESAQRIADAAQSASGFCMVGFHNRFAAPVETLTAYRRAGELGTLSHVEADYIRRRGIPNRGSWFTQRDVSGGGSLVDIGVHAIDLSLYLLGYPDVLEVSGQTRSQFGTADDYAAVREWGEDRGPEKFDVDDSASAFIRCGDGKTISLEVAWATNRPDSQQYYVRGDEAGAGLDLTDGTLTMYETSTAGRMHNRTTDVEPRSAVPHAVEEQRFLEAVATGNPPGINTVEQALTVQRVIDAIYRSSDQGRAVRID